MAGRKWLFIILAIFVVGGGYAYYRFVYLPEQAPIEEETVQIATVRRGDLVISVSGIGATIPAAESDIGFTQSGTLAELNVQVGDEVKAGDVLARLGDLEQLEAEVESDRLSLLNARQELDDLYDNAGLARAEAEQALLSAQETYNDLLDELSVMDYQRCAQSTVDAYYADYLLAQDDVDKLEEDFDLNYAGKPEDDLDRATAISKLSAARETRDKARANLDYCADDYTAGEISETETATNVAEAQLEQAQNKWEKVKDDGLDEDEISLAEQGIANAEAQLAVSQQKLDGAILPALMDGVVTSIAAGVGEQVGTGTFITLADLSHVMLEIYMDEVDLASIKNGCQVEVIFDAMPDEVFTGQVVQIYPELVVESGANYIKGIAQLDEESVSDLGMLPVGMNAAVDVISGKAENALLAPVEALRDLGDGQYAVFVEDKGELKIRFVEVGLMDVIYAEITSGLKEGERVSTGIVETE